MSFWRKLFGKPGAAEQSSAARAQQHATATPTWPSPSTRGPATKACLACRRTFDGLLTSCPQCGNTETMLTDCPEWFVVLQAHVTAIQANDTAVRLFREGRLDTAIVELQRGLMANPHYATGHSNLGFLYLRQGQLDQAVTCLLRALAADPHHKDAPNHLVDVLGAFMDELVQIGFTDGFLSTQPGGKFDDHNRHIRTREIGTLIAAIAQRRIFEVGGKALASELLLGVVISNVEQKMSYHRNSTCLKFAWEGIGGWYPAVATVLPPHRAEAAAHGVPTIHTPRSEVLGIS
jgi:RNA polymerase subunit RPABC4/transcription elongation factor Spt4